MAQKEYNTNRKYRHLTREKRAQIEVLLQLKLPKSRIAREVGIVRSTLYNELARGTVEQLGSDLSHTPILWRYGTVCLRKSKEK